VVGKPFRKGIEVLLGQDRRRYNERYLFSIHGGKVCRPHRHLGFPVTHVTGDQSIHRGGARHIGNDIINGGQLVGRLFKGEESLKFGEVGPRARKRMSGRALRKA